MAAIIGGGGASPSNNNIHDYGIDDTSTTPYQQFNGTKTQNATQDGGEIGDITPAGIDRDPSPTLSAKNYDNQNCTNNPVNQSQTNVANGCNSSNNNSSSNGGGKVSTHVPPQSTTPSTMTSVQQKDTTFTKIFVGGLPYHTTDDSLRKFFQVYGDIEEAVVITDRQTGKSRGYGFVTMSDRGAAERAVKEANPIIDGRKANVNLAYIGAKPRSNSIYGSLYLNGMGGNGTSNNLNGVNAPLNALYTGLFQNPNGLPQIIYNPLSTQLLGGSPYITSSSPNAFSPLISQQQLGPPHHHHNQHHHHHHQQSLLNALVSQGGNGNGTVLNTNLGPLIATPNRINGVNGGALGQNGINFQGSNPGSHHLVIPYEYGHHLNGINSINFLGATANNGYGMVNGDATTATLGIGLHQLSSLESEHILNGGGMSHHGSLLLAPSPGSYLNGSSNALSAHASPGYHHGLGNPGSLRGQNDATSPMSNNGSSTHHRTNHINFPS